MNQKGFDIMTIAGLIIAGAIIIGGLWLSAQFIDFEDQLSGGTANTTGSLDIDTDVFDDIQDEMEDFADDSFDGFDFTAMNEIIVMPIVALVIVGLAAIAVVYLTKR